MNFLMTLIVVILGDWIALGTYEKAKAWYVEKAQPWIKSKFSKTNKAE